MKTKHIEIIVQPNGQLQIEANGFTGTDCEQATRFLEEALGCPTTRKRTPDYYRANTLRPKRPQRLGGDGS